jgi:hypothetical protein
LIVRSEKFGTTRFGSATEAARINTEKMLKQYAGEVAIFEFSSGEAYYIWLRLAERRGGIIKIAFAIWSLMGQFYAGGVP